MKKLHADAADSRRDEILRRALNTPPKHKVSSVKKPTKKRKKKNA